MTLIEGVGDEVVQFVISVLLVIVGILAWWSTNARPNRYRPVMMMRTRANQPLGAISLRTRTNYLRASRTTRTVSSSARSSLVESRRGFSRVIPLLEMDSIIDADMAVLDNNRLHFYRSIESTNNTQRPAETQEQETATQEEPEPARNAQMAEMDSIISAMEADETTAIDFCSECNGGNSTNTVEKNEANNSSSSSNTNVSSQDENDAAENVTAASDVENEAADNVTAGSDAAENVIAGSERSDNATAADDGGNATAENINVERDRRKILIKLKYLNDTLKEVEGSLDELLKDFKWRHFSAELSAESRVRLIFNGRVLAEEAATLEACGLHHRAVVHCLVHPNRNNTQQRAAGEEGGAAERARAAPERHWDMENILMTIVSIALTVVWFVRCEYSNMFTASASVALFGLTVFYSVAIFGLYLSDTFPIDRRPTDPHHIPHD